MHDVSISTEFGCDGCAFPYSLFNWLRRRLFFFCVAIWYYQSATIAICYANSANSVLFCLYNNITAADFGLKIEFATYQRIHGRRSTNRSLRPSISITGVNRLRLASQTHQYRRSIMHPDRNYSIVNMSKYHPMSPSSTSLTRTALCSLSIRHRPYNWPICISPRASQSATKTAHKAMPAMLPVAQFRLPSIHSKTSPPDLHSSS